ncbi:hypothetical protein J2W46_006836 [Paraburkholderia strydomiana]|nr:hypothetical protein [Paraburkholderia strydomiana]
MSKSGILKLLVTVSSTSLARKPARCFANLNHSGDNADIRVV